MKFQALGSNYSLAWASRQLCRFGTAIHRDTLIDTLGRRYDGTTYLYAKGRHALSEAMRIARVNTGRSSVVINSLTCSVAVDAALAADTTPVFADISSTSCDFSAATLDHLCKSRPDIGAVVIQNTFGVPVDIVAIEKVARTHHLIIIEDLAHSVGQVYPDGREVGTVGDLVMLSFGRDKVLDCVNGGALVIRQESLRHLIDEPMRLPRGSDQLRDRCYPLLTWLVQRTYTIGLGKLLLILMYRLRLAVRSADGGIDRELTLPTWQARQVLARLDALPELRDARQSIMTVYHRYLGDQLLSSAGVIRGAIRTTDRRGLLDRLRRAGYELHDTWYDTPIGPERKFASYDYPSADCPEAIKAASELVNLPTHQCISEKDAIRIAEIARRS